jgi:hypothetical protein
MASNRLKLNADKTQTIWFGTRQQLKKVGNVGLIVSGHFISPQETVTCLGVELDPELTFAQHIRRTAARCFYQLRQLWSVRKSLSDATARILVHALIISRVDYCNSILHRVAEVHFRPLQLVMNAAARLITRKRRFDHITATLRDELHWLPARQRIEFKLCLLVFKCLRQVAPLYLTSMCVTLASGPMSHLRSAAHGDLLVPRCRTAGYGPRSFAVAGPACWNNLPLELKTLPLTSEQFVSRLKTVLFRRSY